MLNKSNQWIVLSMIAVATAALIGCNNGGGGGGGAPVINCSLAQNYSNPTCLNSSRGNTINPYGRRGLVGAGGYRMALPPDGIIPLTNPNLGLFTYLCSNGGDSAPRVAGRVRRTSTGWGGSGWGDSAEDDRAYYQEAGYGYNQVCMNIGTVVLTFSAESHEGRTWIGWKFYFVPVGVPVPPGATIDQITRLSRNTSSIQFDDTQARKGPNGFGARTEQGIGLDFTRNGEIISVNVLGPQGPVGSGSMSPQGF